MVRHKVGLSFQLLLWERKVLIPGSAFSEWGKRIRWKALLYSFALCTEVPGAELGSQENQHVTGIKVDGHSSQILLFITTANLEPWNRWKKMLLKARGRRGCSGYQNRELRFWPGGNLSWGDCEFPGLSPSYPLPDNTFKLKATYVPGHRSVYLLFSTSAQLWL